MKSTLRAFAISAVVALGFSAQVLAAEVAYVKQGVTVWKEPVPSSNAIGFRAQKVMNLPLNRVAAALTDTEHSNEWIPRVGEITTLRLDTKRFNADMLLIIDMPFPLNDRELYITSQVTRLKNGNVNVSNMLMKKRPTPKDDRVQMTDYSGGWKLERINDNQTRVTVVGHADPAGMIPMFVSNLFALQQPFEILQNLQKQAQKARYANVDLHY